MKNRLLYLIMLCTAFVCQSAFAGAEKFGQLSGTVTNKKGLPVSGATILIKGTNIGTSTDVEGKFSLNITGSQTLVISAVGYKSKEITVSSDDTKMLAVTLDEDALDMNAVVVTG